ncbi:ChuX/HutX family heme-like substrate-binding protein [Chelativorans sp. AA-79]|uniref:hemin-degrading factor n=1 Tax=Chelativorans sp. AA-79 TaxID=3028735 RepID=UPI0023F6CD64|nr:ChuX/HutX family heme-like substrate-binding protein [Chelativorans sp. AA-79]WEX11877.1 ChuX/HutX family heme-like substrate-binding protein [Chelativorans sp. AA-79]
MVTEDIFRPEDIRRRRAENPKMRERDLARILGISEAELVAAHCGHGVRRIEPRVAEFLAGMQAVGSVMALTRNESAVHEKIGVYENASASDRSAIVLGRDIDLRIFPSHWVHGFAVEKRDGGEVRHSLQFFDRAGDAVHKVHLRPESDLNAYLALVEKLSSTEQSPAIEVAPIITSEAPQADADVSALRERWTAMQDVHQFVGILRSLKLTRRQAVHLIGEEFAWRLDGGAVPAMMERAVEKQIPIMCFVGSRGCIQIHSGPVVKVVPMGPWLNVMDPTFHLHLRLDHLVELWAVRKPTRDGHVTSLEAYNAAGHLVIQFFGKRHEGEDERADWRGLVEGLPRLQHASAA